MGMDRDALKGGVLGLIFAIVVLVLIFGGYLAYTTHETVQNTRTLLTDGKTASAETSKHNLVESLEIKNGVTKAVNLLVMELDRNHNNGLQIKAVLCSVANTIHDTSSVVAQYCKGS